ncbi:hypothetical protein D6029_20365 [Buttiauxella izardii]|uniref:Uncharacterized protein n=1 Tax=Buttiauxella izardii TaxID=82991 RepID=A0A3A5JR70_9ENTR|nr:hypothetical protein D6029_20365 [Buttiauxella izardii]
MAHILLSRTYKSNNFSQLIFNCTLHAQFGRIHGKKSVLSTSKIRAMAKRERLERVRNYGNDRRYGRYEEVKRRK